MFLFLRHSVKWLYVISYLLLFLKSFHFKFFWNIPESIFLIIPCISSVLFCCFNHKYRFSQSSFSIVILLFCIITLQIISNSGIGIVGQLTTFLVISPLIFSRHDILKQIFLILRRVFAIICLISLIGWILVFIFHFKFPYRIVTPLLGYSFYDYGFFNVRVEGVEFTRYLGMFLEPGYTGILCVLFLISDRINLKRIDNIVILFSALFTLSLSAYVLLFISVLFLFPVKRIILILSILLGICLCIYLLFNDVINIIDESILGRISRYLNSGKLFGNRFSDAFNAFYREHITDSSLHYLFGIGSVQYLEFGQKLHLHSAGYRVYLAEFGLINCFFVLAFYWKVIVGRFLSHIKRSDVIFFIIWILSFVISAYPTWCSFLILIITSSAYRTKSNLLIR